MEISSNSHTFSFSAQQNTEKPLPVHEKQQEKNAGNAEPIANQTKQANNSSPENDKPTQNDDKTDQQKQPSQKSPKANTEQLDEADLAKVEELKNRDREVRSHEAAHLAAAGQYAKGGPKFDYQRGPDGKNYAVGGEVSIDTSPVPNNPEATIRKARQIRAAAHAPAEPSSQDRQVAAQASQMETKARTELQQEQIDSPTESNKPEHQHQTTTEQNQSHTAQKAYQETKSYDTQQNQHLFDAIV